MRQKKTKMRGWPSILEIVILKEEVEPPGGGIGHCPPKWRMAGRLALLWLAGARGSE